ncbi:MAG TPA: discoidin domain-containing protein, partial [Frankiaceae bacterium]|nr:discoidin domain-containing protein [Frankiaceae bacterium]
MGASSARPGFAPASALDGDPGTSWRSAPAAGAHWLEIDFQEEREYGGLVVDWHPGAAPRAFQVETSADGTAWTTVYVAEAGGVERSYIYLPGAASRFVRLDLDAATADGCGIAELAVQPFEFSRSINAFFEHVARSEPRGRHPRWLAGEQSYWTPIGVPDGDTCAIMNEEGMVEVDRGTFSLEPFVYVDDRLLTWADADIEVTLEDGWIPVPSSVWWCDAVTLRTTAFAGRHDGVAILYLRYRIESTAARPLRGRFFAALRPYQVNPPWQTFGALGGMRQVRELEWSGAAVRVDGDRVVVPLTAPDGFGAAPFDLGAITTYLARGELPSRTAVADAFGYASGAFAFDLPPVARNHADAVRAAAAQVLINRDGPALQPGPRRYTRSWIRDGAIMAAALLRVGRHAEAGEFARWYATYQAPDGNVPCCVDRNGPDWLAEHDSHGELVFAVMEYFRFTGDRRFLAELWPAVRRAVDYLEALRATRLGPEFESAELRARRGLLPESASHEGYLAHPVHSYWDDSWALQGYRDAAAVAAILGDDEEARRIEAIGDVFRVALRASVEHTIADRRIDYVPGSVEWADFDPTAT